MNQWVDFDQTCTETALGLGKEVIRILVTLITFSGILWLRGGRQSVPLKQCFHSFLSLITSKG